MIGIHFPHSGGLAPPGLTSMGFLWKPINLREHGYQAQSGIIYIHINLLSLLYSQHLDSTYFCDGCLDELDLKI